MNELISGKEALIAFANGAEVEVKRIHDSDWQCGKRFGISVFTDSTATKFRLKPRTILIKGIEVPAPFEPKNGEDFYYLDCTSDNYGGWAKTSWRNVESDAFKNNTVFGAWRTEEEIKQVVAALREVFKIAKD